MFGDRVGEQAALVETDVARRAPIRRTAWRSMYSDMSKRISSMPGHVASWRPPRSCRRRWAENRNEPIGFPGQAAARHLDGARPASIALSWPNTTFLRSRSSVFSFIAVVARHVPAGCARSWRRSPRSRSCRWSSCACGFGGMLLRRAAPRRSRRSPCRAGGGR